MMPEEWPIAASAAEENAPPRPAGRDRLATARADFFLDPAKRLTEQERALMTAMLHGLLSDLADEIRAELPVGWAAANDAGNAALVDVLMRARLVDDPALIALLLRRADEERIASAARARNGRREARVVQGLVSNHSAAVSAAAMALILGRGRRRDRFGRSLIVFDDLPRPTAETLLHVIAAALRHEFVDTNRAGAADSELTAATDHLLSRHRSERSADSLTAELTRLLDEAGALTDDLTVAAADEGDAGLLSASLARRAGVPAVMAMDELQSGDPRRAMALLRMAGVSRDAAASLLAGIGDLLGIGDPGEAIGIFERITDDEASAARTWLVTPPAYRHALEALESGHGQRAV